MAFILLPVLALVGSRVQSKKPVTRLSVPELKLRLAKRRSLTSLEAESLALNAGRNPIEVREMFIRAQLQGTKFPSVRRLESIFESAKTIGEIASLAREISLNAKKGRRLKNEHVEFLITRLEEHLTANKNWIEHDNSSVRNAAHANLREALRTLKKLQKQKPQKP